MFKWCDANSAIVSRFIAAFASALMLLTVAPAEAVPSFERQTGVPCSVCHTVFPELTSFGRQFKLRAYSISAPKDRSDSIFGNLPISALLQVSRNTTKNVSTPGAEAEQFPRDRETIVQGAGLYYGGKITDKSGGLVQYFYDGIEKKWATEMFDVRWADTTTALGGKEAIFGFTLSNGPGVTDIYNSTPVWSFPHTETPALMSNAQAATDMRLGGRVGGPGVYALWNDLLYGELALYRTTKNGVFRPLGWGVEKDDLVSGTAPYWRLALQRDFGAHFFSVGAYGLSARIYTDAQDASLGTDRFRDFALDGEYHFTGDDHLVSVHATRILETQKLDGAFAAGLAARRGQYPTHHAGRRALLVQAHGRRRLRRILHDGQRGPDALQHGRSGHGQHQRQPEHARLDARPQLPAGAQREAGGALYVVPGIQRRGDELRWFRAQRQGQQQPVLARLVLVLISPLENNQEHQ